MSNRLHLRARLLVAGLFLCSLAGVGGAQGCDLLCVANTNPKRAFKKAPAVFVARVVQVIPGVDARLAVEEVYKGRVGPYVVVSSGWGADCRVPFVQGAHYLFFATPDSGRVPAPGFCADPPPTIANDAKYMKWVRKHKRVPIQTEPVAPPLEGAAG